MREPAIRRSAVPVLYAHMNQALDMLKFKCWYYAQAIRDGNEERLTDMIPDKLPEEIRAIYDNSHRE